jgi:hypothetical protein
METGPWEVCFGHRAAGAGAVRWYLGSPGPAIPEVLLGQQGEDWD